MPFNRPNNFNQPKVNPVSTSNANISTGVQNQNDENSIKINSDIKIIATDNMTHDRKEKTNQSDQNLPIIPTVTTDSILTNTQEIPIIREEQNINRESTEVPHTSRNMPTMEKSNPFEFPEEQKINPFPSVITPQNKNSKPSIITKPAQQKLPVKVVPPSGAKVNIFGGSNSISNINNNTVSNSNSSVQTNTFFSNEIKKDESEREEINIYQNNYHTSESHQTKEIEIIKEEEVNVKPSSNFPNLNNLNDQEIIPSYREEIRIPTPSNALNAIKKDLKPLIINNLARDLEDNSVKLNSSIANSPKLDTRSYYTYTNTKNYNNTSIMSMRDKYKNFNETKVSLETQLELANKKCEVYERELQNLRKNVNDLKMQLSRANEESYKLEIARMKQSLLSRESEMQNITKENLNLKGQVKKYEQNIDSILEENKKFRAETEKRFAQFNKEIEILSSRKENNFSGQNREENFNTFNTGNKEDEINMFNSMSNFNNLINNPHSNNPNNYKRENKKKGNSDRGNTSSNMDIKPTHEINNNEINIHSDLNEMTYGNEYNHEYMNNEYMNNEYLNNEYMNNEYDHGNFTNGNPNIIEEVGADNYLNMNGNTYDEMKDLKEDDNLQDHQYFENIHAVQASVGPVEGIAKKPNTGDSFNQATINLTSKGESGATNNVTSTQNIFSTGSKKYYFFINF
jgi:hypothetical protein